MPTHQVDLTALDRRQRLAAFSGGERARQQQAAHPALREVSSRVRQCCRARTSVGAMSTRLMLVGDGGEEGVDGHGRFAGAHVGLQQPLHGPVAGQVAAHVGDGLVLIGGEREGEPPANVRVDLRGDRQQRGPVPIAQLPAAQGQRGLKDQEFLVDEAPPGGLAGRQGFGRCTS